MLLVCVYVAIKNPVWSQQRRRKEGLDCDLPLRVFLFCPGLKRGIDEASLFYVGSSLCVNLRQLARALQSNDTAFVQFVGAISALASQRPFQWRHSWYTYPQTKEPSRNTTALHLDKSPSEAPSLSHTSIHAFDTLFDPYGTERTELKKVKQQFETTIRVWESLARKEAMHSCMLLLIKKENIRVQWYTMTDVQRCVGNWYMISSIYTWTQHRDYPPLGDLSLNKRIARLLLC